MRYRLLLILGISVLALMVGFQVQVTRAQDTCDLTYDFADGAQGWAADTWQEHYTGLGGGSFSSGAFQSEYIPDYTTLAISKSFDPNIQLMSADLYITVDSLTGMVNQGGYARRFDEVDFGGTMVEDATSLLNTLVVGDNVINTFGEGSNVSVGTLFFAIRILSFNEDPFRITKIVIHYSGDCAPPSGDLIRPFSVDDEDTTFGLYDNTALVDLLPSAADLIAPHDPFVAFAWSNKSDAYVMAAGDGTITNIEPFYATECSLLGILFPDSCIIAIPNDLLDPEAIVLNLYEASTTDAFKVTLKLDSGEELVYWVRKANQYVNVGIHISGGCIMGLAMPAQPATLGILSRFSPLLSLLNLVEGDRDGLGLAFVGKTDLDDEQPLNDFTTVVPELGQYADPSEACNIDPRFAGCMVNDSELRDQSKWQTDGEVQWFNTPGIELDPGGSVYQQLNLAADTSYHMIISLFPSPTILAGKPAEVTLSLGDQEQSFPINAGDSGQYEMTVTPAPDLGGTFYTVRVTNSGQAWFVLSGVCVGEDGRQIVPSDCLVSNPSFDYDFTGWENFEGGDQWANGKVLVPTDSDLTQTITVPQGDWTIVIEDFVWANPGWDGTGGIDLQVEFPGQDTQTGSLISDWNLPGNLGFPAIPQQIRENYTVDSETTGDLILTPINATNDDILGIKIDRVCISPLGSDSTPRFTATCDIVSEPETNDFGAWIFYLWHQLNRFFQCDLMVFLNKLLAVIQTFFKTTTWVMRYFVASAQYGGDWASHYLFPWLNGHFRNMAVGQVTTITTEGGCHDLFCAVTSLIDLLNNALNTFAAQIIEAIETLLNVVNVLLNILIGGTNFFFTVFGGVVAFVLALVVKMFSLLKFGQDLIGSLITAYNSASPIAIPGLPMCASDPTSSLICRGTWVLDNTILNGRWGILFSLILAIFSIHLILWAIGEFKQILVEMGGSSGGSSGGFSMGDSEE